MVMPRAFSSGALSIWSNGVKEVFGLASWRTLVMAAVSVVLPWSMWPIVPTLTCGLLRSNFFLATGPISLQDWGGCAGRRDGSGSTRGGAQNGIRTRDLILTKDVLCQLSYLGPRRAAPMRRAE